MIRSAFLFASAAISFAAPVSATTTLTFDTLIAMPNSSGSPVPVVSQLSTTYLSTNGVSFSSGSAFVAVVDHYFDPAATPTPPNIIAGTNAAGQIDYNAPIVAAFFNPANTGQKATTNFVKVLADRFPLGSGFVTLEAFDIGGNLLGTISAPDTGPIGTGASLNLSLSGIHSVRFFSNNRTVGFDNFEFGDLTVGGAVPEPATWTMLIAGFGTVGFAMRRRRGRGSLTAA